MQTGTLDLLVTLAEDLPKQDTYFTSVVAKIVDTLRNLLNNDPQKLGQHTLVNERAVEHYLLKDWKWNEGRYNVQKGLKDLVDTLNRVGVMSLLGLNIHTICTFFIGINLNRWCYEGQTE